MAPNILTELWSFPGRRDNTLPPSSTNQEPFLDWLVLLAADANPPLVHSVSYADDEKDFDGNEAYMHRLNVEFQKAAARGITILFAAGDDGMGSVDVRAGKKCTQGQLGGGRKRLGDRDRADSYRLRLCSRRACPSPQPIRPSPPRLRG